MGGGTKTKVGSFTDGKATRVPGGQKQLYFAGKYWREDSGTENEP